MCGLLSMSMLKVGLAMFAW